MRLLLCCEFYHPSLGGVQTVMRQVAERLVALGHTVTVATSYHPERNFDELNGVRVESFDVRGNYVAGLYGEIHRYREFVQAFDGDAILIKAAQQWSFDAVAPFLASLKPAILFVPCGFPDLQHPVYSTYYSEMPGWLNACDALIFYSSSAQDFAYCKALGLRELHLLPNGADEAEFADAPDRKAAREALGLAPENFIFSTVGTFTGLKGHVELAEAYAIMPLPARPTTLVLNGSKAGGSKMDLSGRMRRFTFAVRRDGALNLLRRFWQRVAGTGVDTAGLDRWVRQARAQANKEVLICDLPRTDVVKLFRATDLFVFISRIEYSPLVLFEAAAAGVPFLASPAGNAAEIAKWTGGGFVCPAAQQASGHVLVDPQLLARALTRAVSNGQCLGAIGERARLRWRERFAWDRIIVQYEDVINSAIQHAHGPVPKSS